MIYDFCLLSAGHALPALSAAACAVALPRRRVTLLALVSHPHHYVCVL